MARADRISPRPCGPSSPTSAMASSMGSAGRRTVRDELLVGAALPGARAAPAAAPQHAGRPRPGVSVDRPHLRASRSAGGARSTASRADVPRLRGDRRRSERRAVGSHGGRCRSTSSTCALTSRAPGHARNLGRLLRARRRPRVHRRRLPAGRRLARKRDFATFNDPGTVGVEGLCRVRSRADDRYRPGDQRRLRRHRLHDREPVAPA